MSTSQPMPGKAEGGRVFDPRRLREIALAERARYAEADPFPHRVLDDFLPADVAGRLLDEFPEPRSFRSESSLAEPRRWGKLRSWDETTFSPFLRRTLQAFCDDAFLAFVGDLSGIPRLVSDGDRAGALRHYGRGGRLGVHADGNHHPRLGVFRRVNLILYLNREWPDAYRGHLELWDARMTRCVKRIAPLFNRAVIFDVGERNWHGFPDPLRCPRGVTRKTLQFYYYTREAPAPDTRPHGTLFQWRAADRWSPERLWHAAHESLRRHRRSAEHRSRSDAAEANPQHPGTDDRS